MLDPQILRVWILRSYGSGHSMISSWILESEDSESTNNKMLDFEISQFWNPQIIRFGSFKSSKRHVRPIASVGVTVMSSYARSLVLRKLHARHFRSIASVCVTVISSCARSLMRRKLHARHFRSSAGVRVTVMSSCAASLMLRNFRARHV